MQWCIHLARLSKTRRWIQKPFVPQTFWRRLFHSSRRDRRWRPARSHTADPAGRRSGCGTDGGCSESPWETRPDTWLWLILFISYLTLHSGSLEPIPAVLDELVNGSQGHRVKTNKTEEFPLHSCACLWTEEVGEQGENPRRHGESMQSPHRKAQVLNPQLAPHR